MVEQSSNSKGSSGTGATLSGRKNSRTSQGFSSTLTTFSQTYPTKVFTM